ncbi:hypothetical protein [Candidatus Endomicrobiellum trichonymphae]|uniref:hypothetical protein n=1 Tax=Endomicrobium trichonymphae TaxID=1408204 RepID=UPI0003228639|nr:hypothetical protein [Candidatus Endomicrobium trichonymphae]
MFKKNVIKFIESQFFKIKTGKMLFRSLVLSLEGLGKSVRRGFKTAETIACIFKGDIPVKSTVSQMIEVGWRLLP